MHALFLYCMIYRQWVTIWCCPLLFKLVTLRYFFFQILAQMTFSWWNAVKQQEHQQTAILKAKTVDLISRKSSSSWLLLFSLCRSELMSTVSLFSKRKWRHSATNGRIPASDWLASSRMTAVPMRNREVLHRAEPPTTTSASRPVRSWRGTSTRICLVGRNHRLVKILKKLSLENSLMLKLLFEHHLSAIKFVGGHLYLSTLVLVLWELTRRMGSHGFTCHSTEATFPP